MKKTTDKKDSMPWPIVCPVCEGIKAVDWMYIKGQTETYPMIGHMEAEGMMTFVCAKCNGTGTIIAG